VKKKREGDMELLTRCCRIARGRKGGTSSMHKCLGRSARVLMKCYGDNGIDK
jgi:hypothetical protein